VDVPVPDNRAFVFGAGRRSVTARAHTLREFVEVLEKLGVTQGSGYLRRRDFSRWIGDVFGDHALARELEGHERRYAREEYPDALGQIADAIRTRYDLTDASDAQTVQDSGAVVTERVRL
jgi:hypothetical protein